jgi:hypothetical protein
MTDRYNGWTNYATWRVNLEMFDGWTGRDVCGGRASAHEAAQVLRETAEEMIGGDGLARDYALAFLSDVNWYEIARHVIDASAEEEAEDDDACSGLEELDRLRELSPDDARLIHSMR